MKGKAVVIKESIFFCFRHERCQLQKSSYFVFSAILARELLNRGKITIRVTERIESKFLPSHFQEHIGILNFCDNDSLSGFNQILTSINAHNWKIIQFIYSVKKTFQPQAEFVAYFARRINEISFFSSHRVSCMIVEVVLLEEGMKGGKGRVNFKNCLLVRLVFLR